MDADELVDGARVLVRGFSRAQRSQTSVPETRVLNIDRGFTEAACWMLLLTSHFLEKLVLRGLPAKAGNPWRIVELDLVPSSHCMRELNTCGSA
jgi:hypothetical protein